MEANYIVVRFGELTTKGKNRKLFTQKLLFVLVNSQQKEKIENYLHKNY